METTDKLTINYIYYRLFTLLEAVEPYVFTEQEKNAGMPAFRDKDGKPKTLFETTFVPGPALVETLLHYDWEDTSIIFFEDDWKKIQQVPYDPLVHKRSFSKEGLDIQLEEKEITVKLYEEVILKSGILSIEQLASLIYFAACDDDEQLYCFTRAQIHNGYSFYTDSGNADYITPGESAAYCLNRFNLIETCHSLVNYICLRNNSKLS